MGETLSTLHATPGRHGADAAEASLVSWVKHYRPDEHSVNSAISYYLKGEVVCLLLDLELRRATDNARSLDDVMRLLWQRYGDESGVPEDGVEAAASEVAGTDLATFFHQALRTTEELDYSVFSHVGVEVRFRLREGTGDKGGSPPRTKGDTRPRGLAGRTDEGQQRHRHGAGRLARAGGRALRGRRRGGARRLDGGRRGALLARCEDKRPGDTVRVTVFRRDRLWRCR
jgi:predicted metalloprotease with PDZ domain